MKVRLPAAAAALALIATLSPARAATQIGEYLSFSGFGTLGAVQTNSDEGQFGKDRQYVGGADKRASFDVDSNLGLQMTGTATSWLSATVQVLASKRDKGHVETDVAWAFVTAKPFDGLSTRFGRMAAPVFAISDSRNVGYANNWLRAPNEVYGLNVFRNVDGMDATYRASFGPVAVVATGFGGKTEFMAAGGGAAEGKNLKGLNLQFETDWATIRLGQMKTTVQLPVPGLAPDEYTFSGVGVAVDRDDVVVQAEYVRRKSSTLPHFVSATGWYLMGGYRFGTVLPYAIVSRTTPMDPAYPALLTARQQTQALGLRWDAFASTAFKLQLDRIDTRNTKGISFATPLVPPPFPGAPPDNRSLTQPVNVLSAAMDFTF